MADWEARAKDLEAAIRRHRARWEKGKQETRTLTINKRVLETSWGFSPAELNQDLWAELEE